MTPEQAATVLQGDELIPVFTRALAYCKEVRDRCLAADIPVVLGDVPGVS